MSQSKLKLSFRRSEGVSFKRYYSQVALCYLALSYKSDCGAFPQEVFIKDCWANNLQSYFVIHDLLQHRKEVADAF